MNHPETSPTAAEAYFNGTVFGHLYTLFAENLARRPDPQGQNPSITEDPRPKSGSDRWTTQNGLDDPSASAQSARARNVTRRRSLLEWVDGWFWRQTQRERDAYLSRAIDVHDVERRIAALQRPRLG